VSGNWFSVRSCVSNRNPLTCRSQQSIIGTVAPRWVGRAAQAANWGGGVVVGVARYKGTNVLSRITMSIE